MAPAILLRSTPRRHRRRCRTGRRCEASAAMVPGPTRARPGRQEWRRRNSAVAPTLAASMAMIMHGPGRAGFRWPISRVFGARSAAPAGRCEMIDKAETPRWVARILAWPPLWHLARLTLVSAYLIGGLTKLL